MKEKVSFGGVMRLAGAYMACAIGSGFATGQEILQFFTGQGAMGLCGTLVTTVLFAWCGSCFMKHGYRNKLFTPEQVIEFYFGRRAARGIGIFMQFFLYAIYVIMVAGAGATLSENFGLPQAAGRILMSVAVPLTVTLGLSKATGILGRLGSLVIFSALSLGAYSFFARAGELRAAAALIPTLPITVTPGGWLWAAILYPAFNAVAVLFVSCCLGSTAASGKEAALGGASGGILFGLAVLTMNLGLTVNAAEIYDKAVPMLVLAKNVLPPLAIVFAAIILCGIYTTSSSMLWGVVRSFARDGTKKAALIAAAFSAVGLALSMTDFKRLVNTVYPVSGYFGLALFAAVALRDIRERRKT